MNFKYTWKKLSEDGLLKDVKSEGYYVSNIFEEYETEGDALQAVKDQLQYKTHLPSELVLVKILNLSWEDRK